MKNQPTPQVIMLEPSEDEIRECAYRLYVESGCIPGHDLDNWLEARSRLQAEYTARAAAVRTNRTTTASRKVAAKSALAS